MKQRLFDTIYGILLWKKQSTKAVIKLYLGGYSPVEISEKLKIQLSEVERITNEVLNDGKEKRVF